tara:strand:- start:353 stop:1204 length:852 start_codon:yes stop_codon:yes gene_type:complete
MANELSSKITLTGSATNFGAAVSVAQSTTFTCSHTSGLAQANVTSTSKSCQIFITDGDLAVAQAGVHEGQFIDITDNYGLKKRYVFVDGAATAVATGRILVAGDDIGAGTLTALSRLDLVNGIAVDVPDSNNHNEILAILVTAINHADGHNGSIVATAPATAADGPQSTTLTNRDSLTPPHVDSKNSTFSILHANTNSLQDHITVVNKGEFASPAILYIRNEEAFGDGTADIIYLYWDDTLATNFMEIKGGQFAYIPINSHANLKAYASDAAVIEYVIFGNNA